MTTLTTLPQSGPVPAANSQVVVHVNETEQSNSEKIVRIAINSAVNSGLNEVW